VIKLVEAAIATAPALTTPPGPIMDLFCPRSARARTFSVHVRIRVHFIAKDNACTNACTLFGRLVRDRIHTDVARPPFRDNK